MRARVLDFLLAGPTARSDVLRAHGRRAGRVALAALSVAACDSTIVLGTDCPSLRGVCVVQDGGAHKDAAAEPDADTPDELDAGEPALDGAADAAEPDVGPDANLPDAEVDVGPGRFPPFQNASFELQDGGSPGVLEALEMPSPIAPWYACRTGLSALGSARAGLETVTPQDGDTFLGDSFPIVALNLNGLNQNFDPPLRAGERYTFAIDVWAESGFSGGNLVLEVGSGIGCVPPIASLDRSDPLPNGSWQRVCIDFTPARDVSSLVLMVTAPEEYLNIGARLYMDDIRFDPECP